MKYLDEIAKLENKKNIKLEEVIKLENEIEKLNLEGDVEEYTKNKIMKLKSKAIGNNSSKKWNLFVNEIFKCKNIDEVITFVKKLDEVKDDTLTAEDVTKLENEYNLCTTPYVNTLTTEYATESVAPYIKKYDELSAEVSEIDSRLTALRERFCK